MPRSLYPPFYVWCVHTHNFLHDEVCRVTGNERLDKATHLEVVKVVQELVEMMDRASSIVDFFKKPDEIKTVKRNIKRRLIESSFGNDKKLRKAVIDNFLNLAKVKFRESPDV